MAHVHGRAVLSCLGDPTRLEILRLLTEGEASVGDLVDGTGKAQSLVSYHLRRLRECGLVERRRQGARRLYRVTRPPVREVVKALGEAVVETRSLCKDPACRGSPP